MQVVDWKECSYQFGGLKEGSFSEFQSPKKLKNRFNLV